MNKQRPYCLSIAGFDPSGGAGVIADCKTFEQLKVNGLSVITCNTIQTEDNFYSYNWISNEIILEQLQILLDRYPVKYVKIGLIKDSEILLEILQVLKNKILNPIIIWDPIILPTYADSGIDQNRFINNLQDVLESVSIITPNSIEYNKLFGNNNLEETHLKYNQTIYLKGGHSEEKGRDILINNGKLFAFNPKTITNLEKHGTGCIFSSALLAYLSRGFPLLKSCIRSKAYVEKRIISNRSLLAYHR